VALASFSLDEFYEQIQRKLSKIEKDLSSFGFEFCRDLAQALNRRNFLREDLWQIISEHLNPDL
jgi:hypothetical protein